MRTIIKGREPASLTQHRLTPYCDYDNYADDDKNELREALVREQRGLCCYCMGRIRSDSKSMKIEHWQSRRCYPCKQLDYSNLLGACLGGDRERKSLGGDEERKSSRFHHCDTYKGKKDLRWNPADSTHRIETRLRYEADGSIRSNDPTFDAQLCQVLNLNLAQLKNNRKGVLDAVLEWWRHEKAKVQDRVPRSRLERERSRRTPQTGELQPYCQVAVWWLDQRLKRMTT